MTHKEEINAKAESLAAKVRCEGQEMYRAVFMNMLLRELKDAEAQDDRELAMRSGNLYALLVLRDY